MNDRERLAKLQAELAELESKLAREDAIAMAGQLVDPTVSEAEKREILNKLTALSGLQVVKKRGSSGRKRAPMSEETKAKIAASRAANKAAKTEHTE